MTYDVKCYELAKIFLDEHAQIVVPIEKAIDLLAQRIQTTIEEFIEEVT